MRRVTVNAITVDFCLAESSCADNDKTFLICKKKLNGKLSVDAALLSKVT